MFEFTCSYRDFDVLHQNRLYSEQTLNSEPSVAGDALGRTESVFHSIDEESEKDQEGSSRPEMLKTRQPDFIVDMGKVLRCM